MGVVRRDGPLIGLHNIDSITGEFFAALRASSTLARRSVTREKEGGRGKPEKRAIKNGRIRGARGYGEDDMVVGQRYAPLLMVRWRMARAERGISASFHPLCRLRLGKGVEGEG
ncbi:hypothetical protein HN011_008916 [Eciton burchellii]|nr:hypothetical protein HN011_008916 [Eciton burchellii]